MARQDDRQCIQQVPPLRQLRVQEQGLPPEIHAPPRRPLHPRAGPGQDVGADPGRARGRPEQRSAIAKKADVERSSPGAIIKMIIIYYYYLLLYLLSLLLLLLLLICLFVYFYLFLFY